MQLKLFLEQTGQSWTLKPNRTYVMGSGADCDIALSQVSVISSRHLKLSFDVATDHWYVEDLGSQSGTFIDNQPITRAVIKGQTRILIAGSLILVAMPDLQSSPNTSHVSPTGYSGNNPMPQPTMRSGTHVLKWGEFVQHQASRTKNGLDQIAIRFFMLTGLRSTPWVRDIEGYTLSNFQEPADKIAVGIEANLGQLKQYQDTDCHTVSLTDAHLVDSATDVFSGIELFALKRGNRRDFRRFCIVSHHRIRCYVIVDNYGNDLFVGRVTRFEGQLDGTIPGVFALLAALAAMIFAGITSASLGSRGADAGVSVFLWSFIIFGGLWCANFLGLPWLMRRFNLLPRPGNTMIVWLIMLSSLWAFFGFLMLLFQPKLY